MVSGAASESSSQWAIESTAVRSTAHLEHYVLDTLAGARHRLASRVDCCRRGAHQGARARSAELRKANQIPRLASAFSRRRSSTAALSREDMLLTSTTMSTGSSRSAGWWRSRHQATRDIRRASAIPHSLRPCQAQRRGKRRDRADLAGEPTGLRGRASVAAASE